jgi:arylsulfatase A-like enzyme
VLPLLLALAAPADADRAFPVVTINPEGRVRVARGPHTPEPLRGVPTSAVVKVVNESGGRFRTAGHAVGGFGKWGLGDAGSPGDPARHGFDEWTGYLDQVHAHYHYPDWLWRAGRKDPLPGNDQKAARRQTYAPDVIRDAALDLVRRHKDRPFFCYLATTIPHAELLVPADSLAGYDFPETPYVGDHYASNPRPRATYAGMVSRLDRDVGRLVALLEELDLDRDTLVLFTGDNGPINAGGADPAFFAHAGPLRGLRFSLYAGGIRVPLIARWPGCRPRPGRTACRCCRR